MKLRHVKLCGVPPGVLKQGSENAFSEDGLPGRVDGDDPAEDREHAWNVPRSVHSEYRCRDMYTAMYTAKHLGSLNNHPD